MNINLTSKALAAIVGFALIGIPVATRAQESTDTSTTTATTPASTDKPAKDKVSGKIEAISSKPPRLQLLVPAYIYLDENGAAEWEKIFSASRRVPIVAIVNASNGPGNERLVNYAKLFQRAEATNASLIGYVSTSYARRPLQDVERDVDKWIRFYPGIKGIFLDEQASGKEQIDYYRQLYHYIRGTCDLKLVVTNPGTLCDENYFSNQASDVICLHEDDKAVANDFFPDWTARYPRTDVLVLPYDVKHQEEMEGWVNRAVQKKFGYIYVTDRDGDDPWDHLPVYWKKEVDAVQKVNSTASK